MRTLLVEAIPTIKFAAGYVRLQDEKASVEYVMSPALFSAIIFAGRNAMREWQAEQILLAEFSPVVVPITAKRGA